MRQHLIRGLFAQTLRAGPKPTREARGGSRSCRRHLHAERLEPKQLLAVDVVNAFADQSLTTSAPVTISITNQFDLTDVIGTVAKFETNAPIGTGSGLSSNDFYVELYDVADSAGTLTPGTVSNFLSYVNDGSYDNTMIHRSVSDFVVQGGGFTAPSVAADQPGSDPVAIATKGTITNEPGNSNLRGTIAMAKLGGQPNSATSQWFINESDSTFLDTDNGGYAVFGEVLGDGMTVVDVMGSALTYDATTYYSNSVFSDLPLWNVNADNIVLPQDFVKIETITALTDESELMTYSVTTSDSSKLAASINAAGDLVLTPVAGQTGSVSVTVTATSKTDGSTGSDTFAVGLGGAFESSFWLSTIRDTLPEDVSTAEPIRLAEVSFIEVATIDGLSLGGPDAELFEFGERVTDVGSEYVVQLRSGVQLDFETRPFLECVVSGYGRERAVTLRLTDVNDRPTLNDLKSPRLTTIEPNLSSPVPGSVYGSTLVRDLLNSYPLGNYADPEGDAGGIAITAVNMQGGMVWFTTDNGATWQEVGGVEERSSVVLYADHATRLYFEPAPGFSGQLSDVITFKAWDRSGRHQNGDREVDTLPELGWEPIESRVDTGALVEQVAVSPDGKTVYAVNGNSLVVIDISNPAEPQTVTTWAASHPVLEVMLQNVDVALSPDGRYAAVAHGLDGMISVLDVAVPGGPQLVRRYENLGPVKYLAFATDGRTVFATRGQDGFHDRAFLTIPFKNEDGGLAPISSPQVLFTGDDPGRITIAENGRFVAFGAAVGSGDATGAVFLLDVSTFQEPVQVARTPVNHVVNDVLFTRDSGTLYVAEDTGVHRLDVTNPDSPSFAGWAWSGEPCTGLALSEGDRELFVAQSESSTAVYDVAKPGNFDLIGRYHRVTPGSNVRAADVSLIGDRFAVVVEASSVVLYELGRSSDVLSVAAMQHPGGQILVNEGAGVAYVNDGWGWLNVVDVSDPEELSLKQQVMTAFGNAGAGAPRGESHASMFGPGGYVFVADGNAGISVFDPNGEGGPELLLTAAAEGQIFDVVNVTPASYLVFDESADTLRVPATLYVDGVPYDVHDVHGPVQSVRGTIAAVAYDVGVQFFEFRRDTRRVIEWSSDGGSTWVQLDAVLDGLGWHVDGFDVTGGMTFREVSEHVGYSLDSQGLIPIAGAFVAAYQPGWLGPAWPTGGPMGTEISTGIGVVPSSLYVVDNRSDENGPPALEVWRETDDPNADERVIVGQSVWSKYSDTDLITWPGRMALGGHGEYAFVTVGGAGLRVLDLGEVANPNYQYSREVDTEGWAGDVASVAGGRWVYVADGHRGVTVIDVAVPENARVDRRIDTLGTAGSVTLSADGKVLYVGEWDEGLIALDVGEQARFSANVDTVAVTVLPPVAQPVVSMPNVEVDPLEVFTVPVEIANVGDLLSASFTVTYDPAVVEVLSVRSGPVIDGWAFVSNPSVAGEILVSAAGAGVALPTGTLFEIDFRAVGVRGAGTVLDITRAEFNDGGVVADTRNGSIQVRQGGSVSGRVTYYSDPSLGVPSLEVGYFPWEGPIAPAVSLSVQTDWSGYYRIEDSGYLRVTPWGRTNWLDWNYQESGISAWDASLVLRYDAGLISLSDYQMIAGDVNASGTVNAFDAALIMRKAVGLNVGGHGWHRDWAFVPSEREYDNLQADLVGQDFIAILVGDVSGNWQPWTISPDDIQPVYADLLTLDDAAALASASFRSADLPSVETSVVLASAPALPGARAKVTVRLDGGVGDVYSLDAVVTFDPTQFRLKKSDLDVTAPNAMVVLNEIEPGRVKLVVASSSPLPRGEVLVGLRPLLIGEAESGLLRLERVELNEGGVPSRAVSTTIERLRVVEADGHVSFGKDLDGRCYADETPLKFRGAEVTGNLFGPLAVVGVDVVRGKNVAYVATGNGEAPKHVWRMDVGWEFGDIEGLGNVESRPIVRPASDGNVGRSVIEGNGLVALARDGNGVLYANTAAIVFAGGSLLTPFGSEFQPVAAEVVEGGNEVLFRSSTGETRRTIHDQSWAFLGVDERQAERLFATLAIDFDSAELEHDRMLALAEDERDFEVELTGDDVLGRTLTAGAGSLASP